ncbi:MAG: rhomboid family intramembrane serine protease [Phototrophicaceae bacterium]
MKLLSIFAPVRLVGKHDYRAYMTFFILFAYLSVFGWEVVLTLSSNTPIEALLPHYAFAPCEIGHVPVSELAVDGIRGLFMTDSFFLLIVNMMYLWIFGPLVEEFLGFRRYLSLFVMAGLVGFLMSAIFTSGCAPLYGPSAAISGVIAAFMVLHPTKRVEIVVSPLLFRRFDVPAFFFGFVYLGFQFLLEGEGPLSGNFAPIWDELGGFILGFIFIFVVTMFKPAPKVDPFEHLDD